MARDLNEAWDWIKRLTRRVARLESGAMLENSSITKGRMRFIGGLLRIDSGGRLEVIGTWRFVGTGAITGDVVAEGKWTQNGSWEFNGPGDIAGDVDLAGNFDLTGIFASGNVRIQGGKMYVGPAGNQVVIDGATGSVTIPGANPIVLRQVGGLARIDLGSAAQIWSGGDGVTISAPGGGFVNVYSDGVDLSGGVGGVVRITDLPTRAGTLLASGAVGADADGTLWRAA